MASVSSSSSVAQERVGDDLGLALLLEWLEAAHDYRFTPRDRDRALMLAACAGELPLDRLAGCLASLLVRNPEGFEPFQRHFAEFLEHSRSMLEELRLAHQQTVAPGKPRDPAHPPGDGNRATGRPAAAPAGDEADPFPHCLDPAPDPRGHPDERPLVRLRNIPWPQHIPNPNAVSLIEPPEDQGTVVPEGEPGIPQLFFFSDVCPGLGRTLPDDAVRETGDALGYFSTQNPKRELDVQRTIERTIDRGVPELRFLPRREVCRVLLLEDTEMEDRLWNRAASELATGLEALGLTVHHATFSDGPSVFQLPGALHSQLLEDWDEDRAHLLLLIVSDGQRVYGEPHREVLEDIATWPQTAWLHPREKRFWDDAPRHLQRLGIPVFEATPGGVREMAEHLASELGTQPRYPASRTDFRVESILGDPITMDWVSVLAVFPVIPPGLAEQIRLSCFPELPSNRVGRIAALPQTFQQADGFRLDSEVRSQLLEHLRSRPHASVGKWVGEASALFRQRALFLRGNQSAAAPFADLCAVAAPLVDPGFPAADLTRFADSCSSLGTTNKGLARFGHRFLLPLSNGSALDHLPRDLARRLGETFSLPQRLPLPPTFRIIPGGEFWMGDPTSEGYEDERPRHRVFVSEFAMDSFPVTGERWSAIAGWARQHGYELGGNAKARDPRHPVTDVSWFDAIKWCNALSEMEGRRPVYYEDAGKKRVLKSGQPNLGIECVDFEASGYRLPTEAEWEKAARGGLDGQHFPWPSEGPGYEKQATSKHANYDQKEGGTTPVGAYPANGFGLFDMAGNVWEWVWDWFDSKWYSSKAASARDGTGPAMGALRVSRGGGWFYSAGFMRCSFRSRFVPDYRYDRYSYLGFRVALGQAGWEAEAGGGGSQARRDDERDDRSRPPAAWGLCRVRLASVTGAAWSLSTGGGSPSASPAPPSFSETIFPAGSLSLRAEAPGFQRIEWEGEVRADTASDLAVGLRRAVPGDFVPIPAGTFLMGDPTSKGSSDERPRHRVWVSKFWMNRFLVTGEQWRKVVDWGKRNGYDLPQAESASGLRQPVRSVSWWDAVLWCNAYSEMEGRRPAYWADAALTKPLRDKVDALSASQVEWLGEGFRLPTEAEWEKAARGGLEGHHYPWKSDGADYNRFASAAHANYDASKKRGTTPVDAYPPNEFGLHDMAGNLWQWVWDAYEDRWYDRPEAWAHDVRGPGEGSFRVSRGGCWISSARDLRCSYRGRGEPDYRGIRISNLGFRVALGQAGLVEPEAGPADAEAGEARRDDAPSGRSGRSP